VVADLAAFDEFRRGRRNHQLVAMGQRTGVSEARIEVSFFQYS
jgi:hypothetical protein